MSYHEKLLDSMSDIQYKYLSNKDELTEAVAGTDFADKYKLMSSDEVEKNRAGVCWDQTEYARTKLEDAGYNVNTFYIEKSEQPMKPTHSFLTFTGADNKKYWFENAFNKHRGIHGPYDSNEAIIQDVNNKMTIDDPNANGDNRYVAKEFTKQEAGIGVKKYMSNMSKLPTLSKQAATITEGYHYARNGHKPVNMLNLNKKLYDSVIASRTKYLKKVMNLTQEEAEYRSTQVYPNQRRFIEKLLLQVAKTKLKGKLVKHPLYFRTDKQDVAWGDKVDLKDRYKIHPDLLKKSTYYPGDTFDLIRGMKVLTDENKNEALATALKKLKTLDEYNAADKRTLRKMKRKGDQYVEGQIWVPYKIEGNNIVPKKENKDMSNMSKLPTLSKQAATITEGYHYARDGHAPVNMLNLSKELQDKVLDIRVANIKKGRGISQEDANRIGRLEYMPKRDLVEKALRETAKTKLKGKLVKHPLYFRTDKQDVAWGDKVDLKDRYKIHPDLLKKSTYYPGDSFDSIRDNKIDTIKGKAKILKDIMTRLKTLKEYNSADGRTLRIRKRQGPDSYIEGQMWAPYDIEGNNIVPKKENKDMNNINKIANLTNRFSTNHSIKIMSNLKKQANLTEEDIQGYLTQYKGLKDKAHGDTHIEQVRAAAKKIAIAKGYKDTKLVDAAALLHDIGNLQDRETHEVLGEQHVLTDPILKERFSNNRLKALAHAVRAHRSSDRENLPRTTLAKIINDADRTDSSVGRAYNYGLAHEPGLSEEEHLLRAGKHMKEKYSDGGYGLKSVEFPETMNILKEQNKPAIDAYDRRDINALRELAGLNKASEEKESNSKRAHGLAKYLRSHRLPAEVKRARSTDSHYIKSIKDIRLSDHKANKNNKALDGDKLSKERILEVLQEAKLDKAALELDLKIGDVVLGGRYKNKRETVKSLETDELGQPMYNGKKLLTLRIEKKLPKNKWSSKSKELNREGKLYKAAKLVIAKKKIYNI